MKRSLSLSWTHTHERQKGKLIAVLFCKLSRDKTHLHTLDTYIYIQTIFQKHHKRTLHTSKRRNITKIKKVIKLIGLKKNQPNEVSSIESSGMSPLNYFYFILAITPAYIEEAPFGAQSEARMNSRRYWGRYSGRKINKNSKAGPEVCNHRVDRDLRSWLGQRLGQMFPNSSALSESYLWKKETVTPFEQLLTFLLEWLY